MPFLFDNFGAKVIRDPSPAVNTASISYLSLEVDNLVFKFSRWRNEDYQVEVSPAYAPRDAYNLIDALQAVDAARGTTLSDAAESWRSIGKVLQSSFPLLQEAFKEKNFARTKEKLAQARLLPR